MLVSSKREGQLLDQEALLFSSYYIGLLDRKFANDKRDMRITLLIFTPSL